MTKSDNQKAPAPKRIPKLVRRTIELEIWLQKQVYDINHTNAATHKDANQLAGMLYAYARVLAYLKDGR